MNHLYHYFIFAYRLPLHILPIYNGSLTPAGYKITCLIVETIYFAYYVMCLFWVFGMHFLNKQKVMDSNKKFKMWQYSAVFSLNYLSFDTRDSICNIFRSIQKKRCGNSSFFMWLLCQLLEKEIAIVFTSCSVPGFFNLISRNDHLSSSASQPAMVDTADVCITMLPTRDMGLPSPKEKTQD